jgi:hypothetical protein
VNENNNLDHHRKMMKTLFPHLMRTSLKTCYKIKLTEVAI